MVKPIYNKHDSVDVQLEGRHPYGNKKPKNDPTCKKLALKRYDQFLFKCWIPQFKTIWSFFVPTKISRNGAVPDRVLLPKKNSNFQFSGFFKCFYKNSNIFFKFSCQNKPQTEMVQNHGLYENSSSNSSPTAAVQQPLRQVLIFQILRTFHWRHFWFHPNKYYILVGVH